MLSTNPSSPVLHGVGVALLNSATCHLDFLPVVSCETGNDLSRGAGEEESGGEQMSVVVRHCHDQHPAGC